MNLKLILNNFTWPATCSTEFFVGYPQELSAGEPVFEVNVGRNVAIYRKLLSANFNSIQ